MEFQWSYFKAWKMMLWKCCTQYATKFGKLSSGYKTGKGVFIPIPKKGNAKECSNYWTIALISHASKVMLKILQATFQQYVNCELPDVQAGFRKDRVPGASVRNSTCDKVMWQSSDGKANQTSGFLPGISWASTPPKIRICLLFHSSNILWKKSNQGFSLLHLKGMFQLKLPLITLQLA